MTRALTILVFVLLAMACLGATLTPKQSQFASESGAIALVATNAQAALRVSTTDGQNFSFFVRASNNWVQVSSDFSNWQNLCQLTATAYLAWNPSTYTGVTGYNVYLGIQTGVYAFYCDAGTNLTATMFNLIQGDTYYISLTAYYAGGTESAYWPEVVYTVPFNAPKFMRPTVQ